MNCSEVKRKRNLHAVFSGSRNCLGALLAITLLSACGGGSGGGGDPTPIAESISGVASNGYPIANGAIQVVCASGAALNTTTDNDGAWQVTTSGQTLPCAVEVNGGSANGIANPISYHSITTSFDTTNVTQLSDLLLANLLSTATPNVWFAGLNPATLSAITSAKIDAALAKQCASLTGLLPLCTTNPITTVYSSASDNVLKQMLIALQVAMIDSYVIYIDLLNGAAEPAYANPPANFNTALSNAFVGITQPISAVASSTAQLLIVGNAMTAYSPLSALGGTPPYTYSYEGLLPAGLSFNTSTGVISGTPTEAYAAADLIFLVSDDTNVMASTTSTVSFTVLDSTPACSALAYPAAQQLVIGTPTATISPLVAIGGPTPYTYSHTGILPSGLSFNTSTGAVNGTPNAVYASSDLIFSVKCADHEVASTTSTVNFTVAAGTGSWTKTGSTIAPRSGATATLLDNGKVLLTGGTLYDPATELYDSATGQFAATGSMATVRLKVTATKLPNGKVLIPGGYSLSQSILGLASAELYDPATGTFSGTGSMAFGRQSYASALLQNGKVLIAGGSYFSSNRDSAELYDPATEQFTTVNNMVNARSLFTATLLQNGKVLLAGGGPALGTAGLPAAGRSAELFDPSTGQFSATGNMVVSRYSHSATLLPNGKVLIAGGQAAGNSGIVTGTSLASAELYDPASGQFTPTSDMAFTRIGFIAELLPNGKVLVAGGVSGQTTVASAELFDPLTGNWSSTGSMLEASLYSASVLLPTGKVLSVGGTTSSAAELYQ